MENILTQTVSQTDLKYAYECGKDCAINGANLNNCNFRIFSSVEMCKEWERGKKENE